MELAHHAIFNVQRVRLFQEIVYHVEGIENYYQHANAEKEHLMIELVQTVQFVLINANLAHLKITPV